MCILLREFKYFLNATKSGTSDMQVLPFEFDYFWRMRSVCGPEMAHAHCIPKCHRFHCFRTPFRPDRWWACALSEVEPTQPQLFCGTNPTSSLPAKTDRTRFFHNGVHSIKYFDFKTNSVSFNIFAEKLLGCFAWDNDGLEYLEDCYVAVYICFQ